MDVTEHSTCTLYVQFRAYAIQLVQLTVKQLYSFLNSTYKSNINYNNNHYVN